MPPWAAQLTDRNNQPTIHSLIRRLYQCSCFMESSLAITVVGFGAQEAVEEMFMILKTAKSVDMRSYHIESTMFAIKWYTVQYQFHDKFMFVEPMHACLSHRDTKECMEGLSVIHVKASGVVPILGLGRDNCVNTVTLSLCPTS